MAARSGATRSGASRSGATSRSKAPAIPQLAMEPGASGARRAHLGPRERARRARQRHAARVPAVGGSGARGERPRGRRLSTRRAAHPRQPVAVRRAATHPGGRRRDARATTSSSTPSSTSSRRPSPRRSCCVTRAASAARSCSTPIRAGVGGGIEIVCAELKRDVEKQEFAAAEFRAAGRSISARALRALVAAFADDLAELSAACRQLIADATGEISEAVVARYYGGRVETNAFAVADAAIAGRHGEALIALRHALDSGADPVPIVAAFAMKVRTMAKVSGRQGRRPAGSVLARACALAGRPRSSRPRRLERRGPAAGDRVARRDRRRRQGRRARPGVRARAADRRHRRTRPTPRLSARAPHRRTRPKSRRAHGRVHRWSQTVASWNDEGPAHRAGPSNGCRASERGDLLRDRRLLFAAWFLWMTPLLAALSSLRVAARRAVVAFSLSPDAIASRVARTALLTSLLTALLRSCAFRLVRMRLICDLMFATWLSFVRVWVPDVPSEGRGASPANRAGWDPHASQQTTIPVGCRGHQSGRRQPCARRGSRRHGTA